MRDCFEIVDKDLLGRVGRLKTRRGVVETPALAPVINPGLNVVPPREVAELGYGLLMTNAYLIKRRYGDVALEMGVHGLLGVETPIMTDSGAYQLMEYGEVEVKPLEIVEYQVKLGSDIGVILDIPTRHGVSRETVAREVEETIRRAREALEVDRGDMLLVGPVQGGVYLDIVARAARELAKLDYDIYAVGGPVQLMENYNYRELVRLVMTAKMNLPPGKPLHLFGAGNPHMLALAVAMGVDLFDSASYALYARDGRYMTPHGVYRLEDLGDLPCECPICSKLSVDELREMPYQERVYRLALHNLYVLRAELRRIRNAIREGSLWELVELRARSHPSLLQALKEYERYVAFIERHHPVARGVVSGLFFYDEVSRGRPEVYRHLHRLRERYTPPPADALLLALETEVKPFSRFGWIAELAKAVAGDALLRERVHVVVASAAYGVVPLELDSTYPLSQYESAIDTDEPRVAAALASDVAWFVRGLGRYRLAVVVYEARHEAAAVEIVKRLRRAGLRAFLRPFTSVGDTLAFLKLVLALSQPHT
ncbi:MAG: tRNA guanosine(15) transglycosylase TgtA [Thermoproteales archaeon]|nr:tRNA guanosine(15) transglycosylase TgtA [Thermoproteales archaeon]